MRYPIVFTLTFASLVTLGLAQGGNRRAAETSPAEAGVNRAAPYEITPGAFDLRRGSDATNPGGVHTSATERAERQATSSDQNITPYQEVMGRHVYTTRMVPSSEAQTTAQPTDQNYQERMTHPRLEFDAARNALTSGNTREAELNLRRAADFLSSEAGPTSDNPDAVALRQQAQDLRDLADRVAQGQVRDVSEFRQPFANSYQALSTYQYDQAQQSWQTNRAQFTPPEAGVTGTARQPGAPGVTEAPRAAGTTGAATTDRGIIGRTGYYMGAAAENARNYATESGHAVGRVGEDALHGAQTVGGKLVQGTGWTIDEVGTGLDKLGSVIHHWGTKMLPGESGTQPSGSTGGTPGATTPEENRY